nr:hypothetical protein [Tanacetum cinerariifolium]
METVINLGNHSLDQRKFSSFFYEFKNNKMKSFVLPDGVGHDVNYVNTTIPPLGKPRERYNVISKLTEHIVQTGLKKLLAYDIVRK